VILPDYDAVLQAYAPFTVAQARLTPQNAVAEIDRLILTAWQLKRPVYMELPSDIAYLEGEVPAEPLDLVIPPSDPERLSTCADEIVARLTSARSPAILVDIDADRFGVADELQELAGKVQLPIAAINTSKAVIDETFPVLRRPLRRAASAPEVRKAVEDSDCLLAIGGTSGGHDVRWFHRRASGGSDRRPW
jgi:indolepyruvate decarboxylase